MKAWRKPRAATDKGREDKGELEEGCQTPSGFTPSQAHKISSGIAHADCFEKTLTASGSFAHRCARIVTKES